MHTIRGLACAGLVAAHLVIAPAAAVAGPGNDGRDAYRSDGRRLAAEIGIAPGAGEDRLRLQEAAGSLEVQARALWPDTFGGLWIDHRAGGAISVAFTEAAAENVAQLAPGFVEPAALRAVTVEQSLASLVATQRAMVADREQVRAGRLSFPGLPDAAYDLDVDLRRNAVVARVVAAPAELRAAFADRYGDVLVERADVAQPVCTREACPPTLRSGLRITNDSGSWCSTAFAARRWSNEWAMLSAAHCNHGPVTGQWARHNNTYYGYTESERMAGSTDAEFHRVVYNGYGATPAIWVGSGETAREVRAKGSYDGLADGSYLCKSGATTGLSCGFVFSKYYSPGYVPGAHSFIAADFCSEGGDSGSGVFVANKAIGILSGSGTNPCGQQDFTVFGHIEFAEDELGVSVVTTDPAPEFTRVDAYFGASEVLAFFSDPLDCWTVDRGDFTARLNVAGNRTAAVPLTIGSVRCDYGLDSVVNLRVSVQGAPVVFPTGSTVSVTLTGIVEDEWGNEAPRPWTRTGNVTIPDQALS